MRIVQKIKIRKNSIQVTRTFDSRIWSCVLGLIQGMTDKYFRPRSNKVAKFAYHTGDLDCESLAQRTKIARVCALFKAYNGKRACIALGDRLQAQTT
jgi:hypothetical protein